MKYFFLYLHKIYSFWLLPLELPEAKLIPEIKKFHCTCHYDDKHFVKAISRQI